MTENRKAYLRNYHKVRRLYAYTFDENERRILRKAHPTWELDAIGFKTKKRENSKKYYRGEIYKQYVEKNREKLKTAHDKYQKSKKARIYHHEWYLKNRERLKSMWAEKSREYRAKNREAYRIWDRAYRAEYRQLLA